LVLVQGNGLLTESTHFDGPISLKKHYTFTALIFLASSSCFGTLQAASFDCVGAKDRLDKAICDDPDLSIQDEVMASKYRSLHSDKLIDQKLLLKEQRTWLRRSRAECGKRSDIASCLKEEYGTRYAELLAYPHSTEKTPAQRRWRNIHDR
jgi:uncharacterized protein